MAIRILHVVESIDLDGAMMTLMNIYRRIDRDKVQFDFVEHTYHHSRFDKEINDLGGRVYQCPEFNPLNFTKYNRWWNRFFERYESHYQIVHSHLASGSGIYLAIAKKHGMYTIAHMHNREIRAVRNKLYEHYDFSVRFTADYFFASTRAAALSEFGKNIVENKNIFRILPHSIDPDVFRYDPQVRQEVRKKLGLENKLVVGQVGLLTKQKNHQYLLQVFKEVHDLRPDSALLIVGDGDLRNELIYQIDQMDLTDSVMIIGYQSHVSRLYQAMDILMMPSLYETAPSSLLEAQCSGLKCMISDRVPAKQILFDDLVIIEELKYSPRIWANDLIGFLEDDDNERTDRSEQIRDRHYDVESLTQWLEHFYLNAEEEIAFKMQS